MKAPGGRLYERVAAILTARIAQGEFAVGQRLPSERELAQTLEVSRPTVREAVIAMELDGLVEVRKGAGVFVISDSPSQGVRSQDFGPFELIEARKAIEPEVCAMAALRISDEQLEELAALLEEINAGKTLEICEDADRRFHIAIAQAAENSVMADIVEMLWTLRAQSPQSRLLSHKAHEAGIGPDVDEHAVILEALRARDPARARAAMLRHLERVLESLLKATEVHEIEEVLARVAMQRNRFARSPGRPAL